MKILKAFSASPPTASVYVCVWEKNDKAAYKVNNVYRNVHIKMTNKNMNMLNLVVNLHFRAI